MPENILDPSNDDDREPDERDPQPQQVKKNEHGALLAEVTERAKG